MSCPDSTAPIDITHNNIAGKCDLKCSFQFQYGSSSCSATNRGHYISLSYDSKTSAHVQWNQSPYQLSEVRLYTPSMHSFGGGRVEGEVVLMHTSTMGLSPLFVCIPITEGGFGASAATALQTILVNCAKQIPGDGDRATLSVRSYNLDEWIPRAPFYSYTGTEMFQPCAATVDYVVFDPSKTPLSVRNTVLEAWRTIVESHPYSVASSNANVPLFYNETGPNTTKGSGSDEIYIDCRPVGASEDTELQVTGGSGGSSEGSGWGWNKSKYPDWLKNPAVQVILASVAIFLFLVIVRKGYEWATGTSMGNIKNNGAVKTVMRTAQRMQDQLIVG